MVIHVIFSLSNAHAQADRAFVTEMLATKADVTALTAAEDDLKRMLAEVQEALARKAERLTVDQVSMHTSTDVTALTAAKGDLKRMQLAEVQEALARRAERLRVD